MTKISVIIPYFKKKKFFKKTINSVLCQTHNNLEVIIIYDDENKKELDFIKEITKKERRVKILVNKKNLGAGYSRNIGIRYATGKYISFIDADDIWKKNKLEKQLKYMKMNNYRFTHTSYKILDIQNNVISERLARSFYNINDLLPSCDIGLSTVMIKI